jgi:GTP-binding protein HflX
VKELHSTREEPPRVFLAGLRGGAQSREEAEALTAELAGLAETLGLTIAGSEIVRVREPNPRYGVGSGKAQELTEKALEAGAQCIVFDREISPSQQRNWEALSGISAVDRQELIIRIFASRARTREAELQAELAELLYALPRLTHKYVDLARQRGGHRGARGAGETRFETDKRLIRARIGELRREIEEVRRRRQVRRGLRERRETPVCALVGYTNAGKSSLHRALTGSDALVEDKLFATLDPLSRRVSRLVNASEGDGASSVRRTIILSDTVGFIRRLPHHLVDAFRSTLEEAAQADILIHVTDAADPARKEHERTVLETLEELGAGNIPLIRALNKVDLLAGEDLDALKAEYAGETGSAGTALVSAKNKEGLEALWSLLEKKLTF